MGYSTGEALCMMEEMLSRPAKIGIEADTEWSMSVTSVAQLESASPPDTAEPGFVAEPASAS